MLTFLFVRVQLIRPTIERSREIFISDIENSITRNSRRRCTHGSVQCSTPSHFIDFPTFAEEVCRGLGSCDHYDLPRVYSTYTHQDAHIMICTSAHSFRFSLYSSRKFPKPHAATLDKHATVYYRNVYVHIMHINTLRSPIRV